MGVCACLCSAPHESCPKIIMANSSAKFTADGYLEAARIEANRYVNLNEDDGSFMICAIIGAIWAAHFVLEESSKNEVPESAGVIIEGEASNVETIDADFTQYVHHLRGEPGTHESCP